MRVGLLQAIARIMKQAPSLASAPLGAMKWSGGQQVASPGLVPCSPGSGRDMTPQNGVSDYQQCHTLTTIGAVVALGISVMVRSEAWGGAYSLSTVLGTNTEYLGV